MRSYMNLVGLGAAAVAIATFSVSAQSAPNRTCVTGLASKEFKTQADGRGLTTGFLQEGTVVNTGILSSGPVAAFTFFSVDAPTTLKCANGGIRKCLYESQAYVEFHNSAADNAIAICFLIDGLIVNGTCF